MKNVIYLLLLLTSCVSEKQVQRYFVKHPDKIEKVFIIDEYHDTIQVVKDSLVVERITDSFYTWFNDTHYIDRWRIKEVLKPCKDSITIVSKRIFTDRYKDVYLKGQDCFSYICLPVVLWQVRCLYIQTKTFHQFNNSFVICFPVDSLNA